ncbi:MAG: DNA polymerase III subunit gamma/tau [Planctomycetota bacterium]|nr:MAG: DNA polymerase III subunit gamma/tau [Planctomycetota bacterium]
METSPPSLPNEPAAGGEYLVVARRYRPQTFDELIGQEHVAQALKGAIASHRVGHAYLFTGARGVGKTSAARILAKALNCARGTSPTPCNECEICRSVSSGDDVDVLEIDGASNRGIDEIRQLRQNVAVRPARARFKIYIIDEVHMLTKDAFNALLKTLEEPPEHVKFIFATTEPTKIPITILSRCQRYDFAGIGADSIRARLAQIAATEGVDVEPEALQIIAMRAAGSMRDSQSLLEQLLSTGKPRITAADVTGLLGLAPAARLSRLVEPLVERNAAAALAELDEAIAEGGEVGQLIDQLQGYFRDAMTQAVGCGADQLLYVLPGQREEVQAVARRLGVQTLLAISQVLDQTAARLRVSPQVRTLAEMALVRICHLQDLDDIAVLIEQLNGGGAQGAKPQAGLGDASRGSARPEVATAAGSAAASVERLGNERGAEPPAAVRARLSPESVEAVWREAVARLSGIAADCAAVATRLSVDAQGRLVASFPEGQKFARDACLRPANLSRLEAAVAEVAGGRVGVVLTTHHDPRESAAAAPRRPSPKQLQADVAAEPFVQRAMELFDGDASRLRYVAAPSDKAPQQEN